MQIQLNFFTWKKKYYFELRKIWLFYLQVDIADTRRIPRGISEFSIHDRRSIQHSVHLNTDSSWL